MATAVEKVRDRLRRAAAALEQAEISYAVVGGNAIAAWVAEVDEAAVRNTRDVDILLRRTDLDRAKEALAKRKTVIKSFIEEFMYPRDGYVRIPERMAEDIRKADNQVVLNASVKAIAYRGRTGATGARGAARRRAGRRSRATARRRPSPRP